jgi:hypothetical protein
MKDKVRNGIEPPREHLLLPREGTAVSSYHPPTATALPKGGLVLPLSGIDDRSLNEAAVGRGLNPQLKI